MRILDWAFLVIAIVGIMLAVRFYYELWKWARQCQHARIAVAYKNKVKLDRPIVEWLGWANQLGNDKRSNGQVCYQLGGTRIAVMKPGQKPPNKVWQAIRYARRRKVTQPPKTGGVKRTEIPSPIEAS